MPGEFDIIQDYFRPLAGASGLLLQDDASVWSPPAGYDLVMTKDVLHEGVHFRAEDPIELIAHKALAVSVSDCVAKGAKPVHYWLGLSTPGAPDKNWLSKFAGGLERAQTLFDCSLAGGDTTKTLGPTSISITLAGLVPTGRMVKRSGANVGDKVYVTGTLGDAALGLHCLLNNGPSNPALLSAYQSPTPPLVFGQAMLGLATSSADVSDGLVADAGHIALASNVRMQIHQPRLPLSEAVKSILANEPDLSTLIWSGGDDYQILFTAPGGATEEIEKIANESNTLVTNIGEVGDGTGVQFLDHKEEIVQVTSGGYEHF